MPNIIHRRQVIVIALVVCAVLGAVLRLAAPDPSGLRDFGTLLLVLWLPVVGNVVGYLMRKLPRRAPELPFDVGAPFTPHLMAELTLVPHGGAGQRILPAPGAPCTVVLGHEGFTARCGPATLHTADERAAGSVQVVEIELSRPLLAKGRLVEGTAFVLAFGTYAVARGRVLSASVPAR